jgi:hypothetical protein
MKFRFIELAGWVLVGLGLLAFFEIFAMLDRIEFVESGPATVIGFFIFRGGIQLIKLAVAARLCAQPQGRTPEDRAAPLANGSGRRPLVSTPPSRLL